MTDAPASTDVVKKNTAVVETKAKKAEGKPRFEVKKVSACPFVWSWPYADKHVSSGTRWPSGLGIL